MTEKQRLKVEALTISFKTTSAHVQVIHEAFSLPTGWVLAILWDVGKMGAGHKPLITVGIDKDGCGHS